MYLSLYYTEEDIYVDKPKTFVILLMFQEIHKNRNRI